MPEYLCQTQSAAARNRRWSQRRPVSAPSLYGSCFSIPADAPLQMRRRSSRGTWRIPGRSPPPGRGLSTSSGSRHQVPAIRPCRRSTSCTPGIQPAKLWAGSKNAPLQSVMAAPSASSRAGMSRPSRYCRSSSYSCTTRRGPHRPVAQQSPHKAQLVPALHAGEPIGRQQIRHNVVVVAGVQGRSRPGRREAATPRTRSMLWYRLNAAHLMAATFGVSATARQYSQESRRPPQAVCK